MLNSDVLWETWRRADARAREAEARLRDAWAVFDRYGTIPPDELLSEVAKLRQDADLSLSRLVAALTVPNFNEPPSPPTQAARDTDPEAA